MKKLLGGVKMINYLVKRIVSKSLQKTKEKTYGISDAIVLSVSQEEVYNTLYFKCRDEFRDALKQGVLRREHLIFINELLDTGLGEKKKYYATKYKNLPHSIYSKLKSPFLDNSTYQEIIKTISIFNH